MKINLEEQYLNFKKECIYLFLSALGCGSEEEELEKLCILEEFKKYFKKNIINIQIDGMPYGEIWMTIY